MVAPVRGGDPLTTPAPSTDGLVPDDWFYPDVQMGEWQDCGDLRVKAYVLVRRIPVGEPVPIRIQVENTAPGTRQQFRARLRFGLDLNVLVSPEDDSFDPYFYRGLETGSVYPNAVFEMQRQQYFTFDLRMAFDDETVTGAALDFPGVYTLAVRLNCVGEKGIEGVMELGEFPVEVVEAEGADAGALSLLSSDHQLFRYLHLWNGGQERDGSLVSGAGLQVFNEIVERFPGARVRPHVLMVLGNYHQSRGKYAAARAAYRTLGEDYGGTMFEPEALHGLLRVELLAAEGVMPVVKAMEEVWVHPQATLQVYRGGGLWRIFFGDEAPEVGGQWMAFAEPGPDPQIGDPGAGGPQVILEPQALRDLEALGLSPDVFGSNVLIGGETGAE